MPTQLLSWNVERDFMGDADRACDLDRRTSGSYVAHGAIDTRAVELDRSGLEDAQTWF